MTSHLFHPGSAPDTRIDAQPAIQLLDVTKSYPHAASPVDAVRGVSLALRPGSFTAVMGPSGSGKSTLLSCAAGLDAPTSGEVIIGGRDISSLSPTALTRFRRDHIGFVFQSYNLIDHLRVRDNITLPVVLAGREPDVVWLTELVETVGLTGMEHRLPGELSGGQAQRVAIARALFTRPAVVFADEPTGALDSHTAAVVLDVLRSAASALGQTVVLVTHDAKVAASADRVLFLADGLLVDHLDRPTPEEITTRILALGR